MSTDNNMTNDVMDIPLTVDDIREMDPAMIAGMYSKLRLSRSDARHEGAMLRDQLQQARDTTRAQEDLIDELKGTLNRATIALAMIKIEEMLGDGE